MIELKNITKIYKNSKKETNSILKNLSIKFNKTGLVFIVGNSLSGKSTLLNIIGGLEKPTEGNLIINGRSTIDFSNADLDNYRNTYISFLFKNNNLIENKSISANINMALEFQEKKLGKGELRRILDQVGLKGISESRIVSTLSNGQKQKVSIIRSIVKNPYVMLADEPTGDVDSFTSREIFDLLKRLSKNKLIIIFTKDQELANNYGDRILNLEDGSITQDTLNEEITPVVENFGLIKTNFPTSNTINNGISNLLHNKLLFIFTILFFVIGFTFIGLFYSSNKLNLENEHIKTLIKNKENEIKIIKYDDIYDNDEQMKSIISLDFDKIKKSTVKRSYLTLDEINKISNDTKQNYNIEYKITQNLKDSKFVFPNTIPDDIVYFIPEIDLSFVASNFDFDIIGRAPINNNEIVISSYVADQIIKNGINLKDDYTIYKPKSYEQIVNDQKDIIITNLGSAKIVGIKNDSMDNISELKELLYSDIKDFIPKSYNEFLYNINNKYNRVYINNDFIDNQHLMENNLYNKTSKIRGLKDVTLVHNLGYILNHEEIITSSGIQTITDVDKNGIVISFDLLNKVTDDGYQLRLNEFLKTNINASYEEINNFTANFLNERKIKVYTNVSNQIKGDPVIKYDVIGVLMNKNIFQTTYYNKQEITKLIPKNFEITSIYTNTDNIKDILSIYPISGSNIVSMTRFSKNILKYSSLIYLFKNILIYVGIIFIIFGILSLIKLINKSIKYRKNEMLIIRTLGCPIKKVTKMFKTESFIVSFLSIIFSNILIKYIINNLNSLINNDLNNYNTYFIYDIYVALLIFIIMFIIHILISNIKINKLHELNIFNNK